MDAKIQKKEREKKIRERKEAEEKAKANPSQNSTATVKEITPEEFFRIRNSSNGGRGKRHISTYYDFAGVYILYNQTKKMYYVGQGKRVFQRVNSHFTGHGNGDVYADYKYGDKFTIKTIKLENSGFRTLNELERNTIKTYSAYSRGYNKTRGNKG